MLATPFPEPVIPFINSYINSGVVWFFSINGPPNLIVRILHKSKKGCTGDE